MTSPFDPLEIRETPLLLTVERSIMRQASVLTCDLAGEENLRRMSRAEFRLHLRERLQVFGDEIMAAWDKLYGEAVSSKGEDAWLSIKKREFNSRHRY